MDLDDDEEEDPHPSQSPALVPSRFNDQAISSNYLILTKDLVVSFA